jgi:hypothetical protein
MVWNKSSDGVEQVISDGVEQISSCCCTTSHARLLPASGLLPAALPASIFTGFSLCFAWAVAAAEQRSAHLLLHFPHPVSQRPHFRHVHNWHEELMQRGESDMLQRSSSTK